MISGDLPIIDMAELVKLHICVDLDDTWAWPPPPAVGPARTMAQRLTRVEEDVHEIQGALEQAWQFMMCVVEENTKIWSLNEEITKAE
nr:hypothetical protein [Tanacetum cinerariifolium]